MTSYASSLHALSDSGRQLARGILALGQTRLDLLLLELQEERGRWLSAVALALAGAVFGLLAMIVLTAGVMMILWPLSPLLAILVPLGVHGGIAAVCVWRIRRLAHDWELLPATVEQLQKDREFLERSLT